MGFRRSVFACCILGLCAESVSAGVIGFGSDDQVDKVVFVTRPPTIAEGEREKNDEAIAFVEQQAWSLTAPLNINAANPAVYDDEADLLTQQLDTDTKLDSYYVHFDPATNQGTVSGWITFNSNVRGIQLLTADLKNANESLSPGGVEYDTGKFSGVELDGESKSKLILSNDRRTVSFVLKVSGHADNFRILTEPLTSGDTNGDDLVDGVDYTVWANGFLQTTAIASTAGDFRPFTVNSLAVPEPSALTLGVIGAIGLLGRRLRRRRPPADC